MELLQVKRDIGKTAYENIDTEINRRIDETDLSVENKEKIKLEYVTRISQEENKSRKSWNDKGKKGIEDLPVRANSRIVCEGQRTYKMINKTNKEKPNNAQTEQNGNKPKGGSTHKKKSSKDLASNVQNTAQKTGEFQAFITSEQNGSNQMQGIPLFYPNMPPPPLPFQWVYPQMPQR